MRRRTTTTIRDIARYIDCSHVTVSMVLNNRKDYSVAPATRQRIVDAAAKLGYVPNLLGRALVSGKTETVILWINRLHTSIYSAYYAALLQLANAADYRFAVSQGEMWDDPYSHPNLQVDWPSDGVIAVDTPQRIDDWLATPQADALPIVSVGPYTNNRVDTVAVDLAVGTEEAVKYLISRGRRRIEYLVEQGTAQQSGTEARSLAYRRVMADAGLQWAEIVAETQNRDCALAAVAERLKTRPLPDAIFAHTDQQASSAIRAIADAGLSVPGDIAVIGVDGVDEGLYMTPRLATVAQPVAEACAVAWDLLAARMQDPDRELQHITLEAHLELRESAG